MARIVRLTESQLQGIINKVIKEQQNLAVGQNFQKGAQTGAAVGQQARQVVNKAVTSAVNLGKEVTVTIGKTTFYIIIGAGYGLFLIGKAVYKVNEMIVNAIIKFISATGKAVVKTANQVSTSVLNGLQTAGIAINKGLDVAKKQIISLKDSGISVVKWVINQFKSLGTQVWAKVLVAASQVKEFGQAINTWLGQQWATIQNQIGVAWDKASSWASGAYNKIKQGASSAVNAVTQGATNLANNAANVAGNVWGGIQGFLGEMFERMLSFKGTTTDQILSEAVKFNGKSIL